MATSPLVRADERGWRLNAMSTTPPSAHAPTTVSLADEDAVKRIVIDTLFDLRATVNNLSRLYPSKRERYRVTVFGSGTAARSRRSR